MLDTVSKIISFAVRNRFSGKVQFTAEIDCAPDAPDRIKMGLAIKWAIKSRANLSGAYLSRANLSDAYLSGANLSCADLSGAYLSGANLSDADLSGADLSCADLSRADLSGQWIIQGATRSDGHAFFLQKLTADSEPMVKAGCRHFTLRAAQAHWEKTRAGTSLLTETNAIIRCMVDIAHARGLMVGGKAV